ncbi:hypothetical protein GDO86_016320 [Hymenochirus boettgeri]|uniref:Uncharacterized protein n=1 Tax=Hymenochirus boettgeri TaxID=247094 RepID=A0A8T2K0U6_9PIPI|nr:hypothetical protein GDO86_016320 [Hymenochirus boettgeri]
MFQVVTTRLPSRVLPAVAAVLFQKKEEDKELRRGKRPKTWRKEIHHYYNLRVKVLGAKNIHGADLCT